MSCPFCAESIRKAYDRTPGVNDVNVSLAHEEVLVEYEEGEVEAVEDAREVPENPAREHVTFRVDMTCGGCERRVRNGLLDRQGVADVETSVENQRVEIEYNPHAVEREKLAEIIRERDFEVSEVAPPP